MHKKQFRNRKGISTNCLLRIMVSADKQFKSEFYMTPKQSRKYWGELNSSLYSSAGFRTQLIKFKAIKHSNFSFWSSYLINNKIHHVK